MPKKNKKIPVESGTCPKCGHTELNFGDSRLEDGSLGYEWACPHCKARGVEWYTLEFSSHMVETKDGPDKYECFGV